MGVRIGHVEYCSNECSCSKCMEPISQLAEARRQLDAEKAVNQAMKDLLRDPVKSPCGHSSQYAHSEDGGKNIVCFACSHSALAASQQRERDLREALSQGLINKTAEGK